MKKRVASCELRGARRGAPNASSASGVPSSRHSPLATRNLSSAYRLPPTAYRPRLRRPGISLLEVLISMFVLLFGLMGVAAIFPVGSHYASRGEQYERGAALADAAFADLTARGMLQPSAWIYGDIPPAISNSDFRVMTPSAAGLGFSVNNSFGPGHAFVIDPMGIAAANAQGAAPGKTDLDIFPYSFFNDKNPTGESTNGLSSNSQKPDGTNNDANWKKGLTLSGTNYSRWPIRRVTVASNDLLGPTMTTAVAETICRLRDDVANETPKESDHPAMQRWRVDANTGVPLTREYAGGYSWLATVVPTTPAGMNALQPSQVLYGSELYEVSVAVFHKRDMPPSPKSERSITAALNVGGELVIYAANSQNGVDAVDNALKDVHPGDWIALAGVHPQYATQNPTQLLLKWYRLLSLDDETQQVSYLFGNSGPSGAVRRAMVEGPDWPVPAGNAAPVMDLRAIIVPGIIGVSTHMLHMEPNTLK
jgi:hypothetical protein